MACSMVSTTPSASPAAHDLDGILTSSTGVAGGTLDECRTPTRPFRTATVKRGDLHATISGTGTLEPEKSWDGVAPAR